MFHLERCGIWYYDDYGYGEQSARQSIEVLFRTLNEYNLYPIYVIFYLLS